MKTLYLDCFAGIAGDMMLGALLDAGADLEFVKDGLSSLAVNGYTLEVGQGNTHGIAATYVRIHNTERQSHRHLSDIIELLNKGDFPEAVRTQAVKVFHRLAEAEAKVHGVPLDQIHFHEVGAIDSICDIMGSLLALHSLKVQRVVCSPIPLSSGTVQCEHGLIPVPAPATMELLKGVPTRQTDVKGELVTPTGAVLATTVADCFESIPAMVIERIGYGMGSKDHGFPNVLRAIIGETENGVLGKPGESIVIEASIDDLNPELYPYVIEKLLEAGAPDAFLTPIIMKGGRPGILLTVLAIPENWTRVARVIFQETSTLGFRIRRDHRQVLLRKLCQVATRYGEINVKYAYLPGEDVPLQVAPEYRDCRDAAERTGVPLKAVYNEAIAAALQMRSDKQ